MDSCPFWALAMKLEPRVEGHEGRSARPEAVPGGAIVVAQPEVVAPPAEHLRVVADHLRPQLGAPPALPEGHESLAAEVVGLDLLFTLYISYMY